MSRVRRSATGSMRAALRDATTSALRPPANAIELPEPLLVGSTSIDFRAGDVVFRRGDAVGGVYLAELGTVRLLRYGRDGEEIVLHEARAGELFAEAAVDAARYHCDAVVAAPSRLVRLPVEPLRHLLATDAPFASRWASLLAAQLRITTARSRRSSATGSLPRKGRWTRRSGIAS